MNLKHCIASVLSLIVAALSANAAQKLTGTPIGTTAGWNYESNSAETSPAWKLFDGDLSTYFATQERSYTWAGLDLGTPHVITRVGWSPRNDTANGENRVVLGVFQGANSADFLDAIPIYMITEKGTIGTMSYGDVDCSRGFRYVRYVGPSDARCNVAELEFYGEEGAGNDSHLFQLTNLPTVVINTVDSEEPYDKEHDITSNVIIINDNKSNVDKPATVRERGNGSRTFPKKPWRIKFDKKQNVLDAPAKAKKWTLINNYGDKTLLRNILAFEIARRIGMAWVPYCRPVDVFLNGEFKGCYQLCDQVEVNPGRLEITEMAPTDIEGDALTGGYFLEIDAYASEETSWFQTSRGNPVTIKSPDDDEIVAVQSSYIKDYFQQMENAVYSNDYLSSNPTYFSMLDMESFLQYFLIAELDGNTDSFWSTYMSKERGADKFITGPIWDVDLGFENDGRTYPITTTASSSFLNLTSKTSVAGNMRAFVKRILNNNANKTRLSQLWSIARNDQNITVESLNAFIDEQAAILDQSQKLNFMRWPILSTKVHQNPRAAGSYAGEVQYVKNYITARIPQLDQSKFMNYDASYTAIDEISAPKTLDIAVVGRSIVCDGTTVFKVYSTAGVLIHNSAETTSQLTPGIYIVVADNVAPRKVLIR
jgi:hypothetical protein